MISPDQTLYVADSASVNDHTVPNQPRRKPRRALVPSPTNCATEPPGTRRAACGPAMLGTAKSSATTPRVGVPIPSPHPTGSPLRVRSIPATPRCISWASMRCRRHQPLHRDGSAAHERRAVGSRPLMKPRDLRRRARDRSSIFMRRRALPATQPVYLECVSPFDTQRSISAGHRRIVQWQAI